VVVEAADSKVVLVGRAAHQLVALAVVVAEAVAAPPELMAELEGTRAMAPARSMAVRVVEAEVEVVLPELLAAMQAWARVAMILALGQVMVEPAAVVEALLEWVGVARVVMTVKLLLVTLVDMAAAVVVAGVMVEHVEKMVVLQAAILNLVAHTVAPEATVAAADLWWCMSIPTPRPEPTWPKRTQQPTQRLVRAR